MENVKFVDDSNCFYSLFFPPFSKLNRGTLQTIPCATTCLKIQQTEQIWTAFLLFTPFISHDLYLFAVRKCIYSLLLMIHAYYPKTSIYSITKLAIEQIIFGLLNCNFGFGSLVIWLCAWIRDFYRIRYTVCVYNTHYHSHYQSVVSKENEFLCGETKANHINRMNVRVSSSTYIEKNRIKISWTKIRPDIFGDVYLSVESVPIVRTALHSTAQHRVYHNIYSIQSHIAREYSHSFPQFICIGPQFTPYRRSDIIKDIASLCAFVQYTLHLHSTHIIVCVKVFIAFLIKIEYIAKPCNK